MVDAGMTDTITMTRAGHLCFEIVTLYKNVRGFTCMKQQAAILPSTSKFAIHGIEHQEDVVNEVSESVLNKAKVGHEDGGHVHGNVSTQPDVLQNIGSINVIKITIYQCLKVS